MSTDTQPGPTTLGALTEIFAQQLLAADSPYLSGRNVVLRMRVPIPNAITSPASQSSSLGEEIEEGKKAERQSYTYTHLDISVPTKLFLAAEGVGLQAAKGGGVAYSPALGIVWRAIEDATGVRLDEGYHCEAGPGVEVISVRIVQEGDVVDLSDEKGYNVSVVSTPPENVQQPAPTINSGTINPRYGLGCQCRYFLPADYTIYLKSDDEGEEGGGGGGGGGIVSTFHVNRFLLGLRIPYFRNMFSSGMADSGTDSSTLYTDTFSAEALTIICRYIYLISDPRNLFWFCGFTGQSDTENEALLQKLKNYIYLYQLDVTESVPTLSIPKPTSICADYLRISSSDGLPPPVSVVTHLTNVVKAADYLGLDDLKSYITHTLTKLAHNFHCYGPGCAVLLPKMLDKAYSESVMPKSLLNNLVKILGQTKAVQPLWKRSLIMMSPEAISYLLTHIQNRILHDPIVKRTNEGGGILAAFVLYVALAKLRRQVRGKSRDAGAWEEKLITPLMEDFLTKQLAGDLSWCYYLVSRGAAGLDIDITQGLVRGITIRFMSRENCEKIWKVVSNRELEFWDEQAMKSVVEWFKKEWLSLSVTPPEPDPRTSARPIGGGAEVAPGGAGAPQKKVPRMKEAYEPNFFATWDRRDLILLGREVGVEVEDLLAQGHRAGLPPRTPRRSVGIGEVGGSKRRDQVGQPGSGGGAVIPPVGTGGGRTGQSGGATLLNSPGASLEGTGGVGNSGRDVPSPAPAATTATVATTTRVRGRGNPGTTTPRGVGA